MSAPSVAARRRGSPVRASSSSGWLAEGDGVRPPSGNEEDEEEEEEEETSGFAGGFDVIRTIGTGTFGRVCLAREKVTGKFYAVKVMAMRDVIRLKQTEHVKNEKSILEQVNHPFITRLKCTGHDGRFLYVVLEYVGGGELFSYLRTAGKFPVVISRFYAAEIVLAIGYLHGLSIVYRDLKPENLLLDNEGHLKITDFGFAKKLTDRTWTLCGTPEYLAPEIIQSRGHNKAVDWWALGILIYEMLVGFPPFVDDNLLGIYEKILAGKVEWFKNFDPVAKDLVKRLLTVDRSKRLGSLKAPIIPTMAFDGDAQNFNEYPEDDWRKRSLPSEDEAKIFAYF